MQTESDNHFKLGQDPLDRFRYVSNVREDDDGLRSGGTGRDWGSSGIRVSRDYFMLIAITA